MENNVNDWYIDKASNFYIEGFDKIVKFFSDNCREKISSKELSNRLISSDDIKISKGNPNATLTHYRDLGIINKDNVVGASSLEYNNNMLDISSLIIDLLLRRFNRKNSGEIRPFILICKFFDILLKMEIDKDEVFLNSRECVKYLYPINDYNDLDYEYVEDIIKKRIYDSKNNKVGNYEFKSNEATNINIWFNALRETTLFLPVETYSKENLIPNIEQRAFFSFIAVNGEFLKNKKFINNTDIYDYYCDSNSGITEILPRVVKKSVSIENQLEVEKIFDYLFGYKMFKNFQYSDYFKYPCFGVYFPFISAPQLAIRQVYYDNKEIGELLYQYLTDYKKVIQRKDSIMIEYQNSNRIDCSKIECKNINYNIQKIYFGAPGTGKSYGVDCLIRECYPQIDNKENPFVFRTTIYSDYSYYNFVGNIMPTSKDGEIGYDFKAGIFSQALEMAFEHQDKEIFLIVEEMSRGNIASIFGDIFQLLDRNQEGVSEYSINNDLIMQHFDEKGIDVGKKVFLPKNFHIIGTVNTSDQNVNVIDTAFKRRFEYVYVDVSPKKYGNNDIWNSYSFKLEGEDFEWNRLYMSLNNFITTKLELSEDKQIGQFFIKFSNYEDDEQRFVALQNKLLHYLWDDVQGAAILDKYFIFWDRKNNKPYKTFSSIYKDFGNKINVFSDFLIEIYKNQEL